MKINTSDFKPAYNVSNYIFFYDSSSNKLLWNNKKGLRVFNKNDLDRDLDNVSSDHIDIEAKRKYNLIIQHYASDFTRMIANSVLFKTEETGTIELAQGLKGHYTTTLNCFTAYQSKYSYKALLLDVNDLKVEKRVLCLDSNDYIKIYAPVFVIWLDENHFTFHICKNLAGAYTALQPLNTKRVMFNRFIEGRDNKDHVSYGYTINATNFLNEDLRKIMQYENPCNDSRYSEKRDFFQYLTVDMLKVGLKELQA